MRLRFLHDFDASLGDGGGTARYCAWCEYDVDDELAAAIPSATAEVIAAEAPEAQPEPITAAEPDSTDGDPEIIS